MTGPRRTKARKATLLAQKAVFRALETNSLPTKPLCCSIRIACEAAVGAIHCASLLVFREVLSLTPVLRNTSYRALLLNGFMNGVRVRRLDVDQVAGRCRLSQPLLIKDVCSSTT